MCNLILFFYIIVFSVMPLSHIHVESQGGEIVTLLEKPDSGKTSFILLLHELLFAHFKDHTDYTLARQNSLLLTKGDPRLSKNNDFPKFASLRNLGVEGSFAPVEIAIRHLLISGDGQKSSAGFRPFSSGLSPPSA